MYNKKPLAVAALQSKQIFGGSVRKKKKTKMALGQKRVSKKPNWLKEK